MSALADEIIWVSFPFFSSLFCLFRVSGVWMGLSAHDTVKTKEIVIANSSAMWARMREIEKGREEEWRYVMVTSTTCVCVQNAFAMWMSGWTSGVSVFGILCVNKTRIYMQSLMFCRVHFSPDRAPINCFGQMAAPLDLHTVARWINERIDLLYTTLYEFKRINGKNNNSRWWWRRRGRQKNTSKYRIDFKTTHLVPIRLLLVERSHKDRLRRPERYYHRIIHCICLATASISRFCFCVWHYAYRYHINYTKLYVFKAYSTYR